MHTFHVLHADPFGQLEGNLVLMRPKSTGSIRSIALYEPLRLALLARREQVEAERPSYTTDHDLVWCRPDGGPIDPRHDWQAWSDLLDAAGVEHVTGHETRHTTATRRQSISSLTPPRWAVPVAFRSRGRLT